MFDNSTLQMVRYGDEVALTYQVATYTPLIKDLTDRYLFGGYTFTSANADFFFKKMFVNRFINREIAFQTVDLFRSKLVAMSAANDQFISSIYDNYDKLFSGESDSKSTNESNSGTVQRNRDAHVTIPQDTVVTNLDDDNVPYADNTDWGKMKSDTDANGKNDNVSHQVSASVIEKLNNIYVLKLDDFDRALFLGVW